MAVEIENRENEYDECDKKMNDWDIPKIILSAGTSTTVLSS
jgi:hypothetical protein